MNNNDLKEKWSKITDLREATAELLEYQDFLGYDPYYSDMREGLLNMMARASETFECRVCKGIPDAPMMKNEVWAVASHFHPNDRKRDLLCIRCVELALGRPIQLNDLKKVPANAFVHHYAEQLKERMAQRFLQWKLPADFNPDGGIEFTTNVLGTVHANEPLGTNLLTFSQAKDMIEYLMGYHD